MHRSHNTITLRSVYKHALHSRFLFNGQYFFRYGAAQIASPALGNASETLQGISWTIRRGRHSCDLCFFEMVFEISLTLVSIPCSEMSSTNPIPIDNKSYCSMGLHRLRNCLRTLSSIMCHRIPQNHACMAPASTLAKDRVATTYP